MREDARRQASSATHLPPIASPADLVSSVSPPGLPDRPATLLIGVHLAIFNIGSQKGSPVPHCSDHPGRYSVEDQSRSKKRPPDLAPVPEALGLSSPVRLTDSKKKRRRVFPQNASPLLDLIVRAGRPVVIFRAHPERGSGISPRNQTLNQRYGGNRLLG